MFFYENYVRLCNSVGKTPSAVAKEIGIQKSTVTRWKNGKGRTDATVQKVADYFGVSKSFLLNSAPDPEEIILFSGISKEEVNDITERRIVAFENRQKEKPPANGEELNDPVTQELFDIVTSSDEDERKALLEMARLIVKRRGNG